MVMNMFNKREKEVLADQNRSDLALKIEISKLLFNVDNEKDIVFSKLSSGKINKAIYILKEMTKALCLQRDNSISVPGVVMTKSQKDTFDLAMKNLNSSSDIKSQEFVGNLYKELQRVSISDEDYEFFLGVTGYQYAMILEHPSLIEVV